MIFQDLDDLKAACSEAAVSKCETAEPRDFEVGVFCGEYVTPVDPEYFKHLEEVRGESRKMKVLEKAREAVANGSADKEELEIAANGVKVLEVNGAANTINHEADMESSPHINGDTKRRRRSTAEDTSPKDRMDISLHNFGDFHGA